jgi:protein-disulfide isomerase
MSNSNRAAVGALFVLLVFIIVFFGLVLFEPGAKRAKKILLNQPVNAVIASPTVTIADPRRGNAHAKFSIIEFADYECVYCRKVEAVINAALTVNPDLELVWKDLPNPAIHKESYASALAARCAGRQGKFWEYHDALFATQDYLNKDLYPKLAEQLGLNLSKFSNCFTGEEEKPVIARNVEEATALGVDGTPYFFIGETRISGEISATELAAILNKLRADSAQ